MTALRADDHAFADGPVFLHPSSFLAAWFATRNYRKACEIYQVWNQFHVSAIVSPGVRLALKARLINLDVANRVVIHSDAVIRGILRNEQGGCIELGREVYLGDDTVVSSAQEILIGENTLLAHGVQVFDNDTHPIDPRERLQHFRMIMGLETAKPLNIAKVPIRIGERCWIGMNTLILKGVTIGDDSIVAAGSVVIHNIPSEVLAAGNPARVVRML